MSNFENEKIFFNLLESRSEEFSVEDKVSRDPILERIRQILYLRPRYSSLDLLVLIRHLCIREKKTTFLYVMRNSGTKN